MRYTEDTILTMIDTSIGEKWPLNDGFWSPSDDPKFCWAQIEISSSGASLIRGSGITSAIIREESGIFTINYSSTFDSQPITIAQAVDISSSEDDRRFCFASIDDAVNDRHRSTTQQTFVIVDKDDAVITEDDNNNEKEKGKKEKKEKKNKKNKKEKKEKKEKSNNGNHYGQLKNGNNGKGNND